MWSIWRDGIEHRLEDVPLVDLVRLERQAGTSLSEFNPRANAAHARALALLLVGDTDVTLSQIRLSDNDLPDMWSDGKPRGGRTFDAWVALLTRPPWSFTPEQIRTEFTWRDLQLIGDANG